MVRIPLPQDSSWCWKKLCFVKGKTKVDSTNNPHWNINGSSAYQVKDGYNRFLHNTEKLRWDKIAWCRASLPSHALIPWVLLHNKLPVKMRLYKFRP